MERIWAGIEGGGTKFVCLLGAGPDDVVAERAILTTDPEETLDAAAAFIREHLGGRELAALGVASFGPIDLDPASPGYGTITTTPKQHWANVDVAGFFRRRFGVPVGWDTDVNGAALAEQRWGAARGLRSAVYFTVGTGIGGGAVVDGRPLHGLLHPEMGHIPVTTRGDGADAGVCPYHRGGCLEGVASGPALEARAGRPPAELAPDDPIWEQEARYLAFAAATATLMLSPQRIIFGGGVLRQEHLYPRIHTHFLRLLNGYVRSAAVTEQVGSYIVAPQLGGRAGALGALALAMDLSQASPSPSQRGGTLAPGE
jgi:fructokinase